jgi:hypothetical protein
MTDKAASNDLAAMILSASIAAPMFDETIDRAELVRKLISMANLTLTQEAVLRRRFFAAIRKIRRPAGLMMYRDRWKKE